MKTGFDRHATCARCGMPLSYDRYIVGGPEGTGGNEADRLCSYCAAPSGRQRQSKTAAPWVLDLILRQYRDGQAGPFWSFLLRIARQRIFRGSRLSALPEMIDSVPARVPDSR
jgi:hypothetical protein